MFYSGKVGPMSGLSQLVCVPDLELSVIGTILVGQNRDLVILWCIVFFLLQKLAINGNKMCTVSCEASRWYKL